MLRSGFFISFEGGEGVGKSTQVSILVKKLKELGYKVKATCEPGSTLLGKSLTELLNLRLNVELAYKSELLLYLADRAQHLKEVIKPALNKNKIVICDRFVDSSEVYQGVVRGLGSVLVRKFNKWICEETWPELTIVLDMSSKMGLERSFKRQKERGSKLDKLEMENLKFHRRIRLGFWAQAKTDPQRIRVIDADLSPHQVAERVWSLIRPILERKRL